MQCNKISKEREKSINKEQSYLFKLILAGYEASHFLRRLPGDKKSSEKPKCLCCLSKDLICPALILGSWFFQVLGNWAQSRFALPHCQLFCEHNNRIYINEISTAVTNSNMALLISRYCICILRTIRLMVVVIAS